MEIRNCVPVSNLHLLYCIWWYSVFSGVGGLCIYEFRIIDRFKCCFLLLKKKKRKSFFFLLLEFRNTNQQNNHGSCYLFFLLLTCKENEPKHMDHNISLMVVSCWTYYNKLIKSAVIFISKLTILYPSWYALIIMCNGLKQYTVYFIKSNLRHTNFRLTQILWPLSWIKNKNIKL